MSLETCERASQTTVGFPAFLIGMGNCQKNDSGSVYMPLLSRPLFLAVRGAVPALQPCRSGLHIAPDGLPATTRGPHSFSRRWWRSALRLKPDDRLPRWFTLRSWMGCADVTMSSCCMAPTTLPTSVDPSSPAAPPNKRQHVRWTIERDVLDRDVALNTRGYASVDRSFQLLKDQKCGLACLYLHTTYLDHLRHSSVRFSDLMLPVYNMWLFCKVEKQMPSLT